MSTALPRHTGDQDLNVYVVSFNCGRKLIDVDFFAAYLLDGFSTNQSRPDIVVLSLQEIAPIAYSFLSSSLLSQYVHRFEIAVKQAFEDKFGAEAADAIKLLAFDNVGMTGIVVFGQTELVESVKGVERGGTGTGLWEMGNKGAVGIRLWFEDPHDNENLLPLSFVAAHLAPMESAWQRRNEDWKSICQRLVFTTDKANQGRNAADASSEPLLGGRQSPKESPMLISGSDLFFAGDLNYRTSDIKPHPDDHHAWPSPLQSTASSETFSALYKQDQLNRERSGGRTLHLLSEAPIEFAPTYKYSDLAQKAAYSLAKERSTASYSGKQLWASHRFPAWCDRILFQKDAGVDTLAYTALPIQPTSDHRPVALLAIVKLQAAKGDAKRSPFQIDKTWRSRRAQARQLEILVGLAAYLTLTYEGNAILAGTFIGLVGGVIALQSLLSS